MKNAHERFGWLEFEKQLKDTRTRLRVALDRFISEPAENKEASGTCHLVWLCCEKPEPDCGRLKRCPFGRPILSSGGITKAHSSWCVCVGTCGSR